MGTVARGPHRSVRSEGWFTTEVDPRHLRPRCPGRAAVAAVRRDGGRHARAGDIPGFLAVWWWRRRGLPSSSQGCCAERLCAAGADGDMTGQGWVGEVPVAGTAVPLRPDACPARRWVAVCSPDDRPVSTVIPFAQRAKGRDAAKGTQATSAPQNGASALRPDDVVPRSRPTEACAAVQTWRARLSPLTALCFASRGPAVERAGRRADRGLAAAPTVGEDGRDRDRRQLQRSGEDSVRTAAARREGQVSPPGSTAYIVGRFFGAMLRLGVAAGCVLTR